MINSVKNKLINSIKTHEGFRCKAYIDNLGVPTFGFGFTWITKEEAEYLLNNRINSCIKQIEEYLEQEEISLDETRIAILVEMCYQLGFDGVLNFKKMWQAIKYMDYEKAGAEMQDSKWFKQTPVRAKALIDKMITGY